jgi:hypothetical protein
MYRLGREAADQGTLRACADAFLAPNVLVCEGATEVGLIRGLDLYWTDLGQPAIGACGVSIADGTGSNMLQRALSFAKAGYRTALWHDSDKELDGAELQALDDAGVTRFFWDEPFTTEMQIFDSMPEDALTPLVEQAQRWHGDDSVNDQIKARRADFDLVTAGLLGFDEDDRNALGVAAGKGKWYKNVSYGEIIGREVIGPYLDQSEGRLPEVIAALRAWIRNDPAPAGDGPAE